MKHRWVGAILALFVTSLFLGGALVSAGLTLTSAPTISFSAAAVPGQVSGSALSRSQAALSAVEKDSIALQNATAIARNVEQFTRQATPSTLREFATDVQTMTQAQFDQLAREMGLATNSGSLVTMKAQIASALSAGLSASISFNWNDLWLFLGLAAAGCIIGGIAGAGIGCIAGIAVAAGIVLVAIAFGQSAAYTDILQWEAAMVSTVYNELALVNSDYQTILTLLNSTTYALETEADAAAALQIDNASFNPALDLVQSFVLPQLDSLQNAFLQETGTIWQYFVQWIGDYFQTGSVFQCGGTGNPAKDYFWTNAATQLNLGCNNMQSLPGNGTAADWVQPSATHADAQVYILQGAKLAVIAGESTDCTLQPEATNPILGSNQTWFSTRTFSAGGGNVSDYTFDWTHQSGVFWFNVTSGTVCTMLGTAAMGVNPGQNTPEVQDLGASLTTCGDTYPNVIYDALCDPLSNTGVSLKGVIGLQSVTAIAFNDGHTNTPNTAVLQIGGGAYGYILTEFNDLEYAASTSGFVYFSFIQHLGYGYPGSTPIPPACIIPYPSQAVPPAYDRAIGNMTSTQLTQLYIGWMNGEAIFYDTPPGVSTFCDGAPAWDLGGAPYSNLFINASGFVFIPEPALYPNETFANVSGTYSASLGIANPSSAQLTALSTWGFNGSLSVPFWNQTSHTLAPNQTAQCWTPVIANSVPQNQTLSCTAQQRYLGARNATQLVMWPIAGVFFFNVTVGTVFEIPAGLPAAIFATEPGGLLQHAAGNGTAHGNIVNGQAAGYAVFLTSCKVNGTLMKVCDMALSTINGYIANLTNCLEWGYINGCKAPPPPPSPGSGYCNWPVIGLFTDLFSEIPYIGSTLGATLGCIVGIVVLVALVIVVAYLIYIGVSHRPRRKAQGDT